MSVWASAGYTVIHTDGTEEAIEVELSADIAGYSPDVASDLSARVTEALHAAYAETWPAEAT